MRIISNETGYSTRALRTIITAIYRNIARHEGRLGGDMWPKRWNCVRVEVLKSRRGRVHGRASLGGSGTWMMIALPHNVGIRDLALIVDHEIHHLYGFRHEQYCGSTHDRRPLSTWDWVAARFGEPFRKELRQDDFGKCLDAASSGVLESGSELSQGV